MALTELARFLPRASHHNRYLRSGMRPHHRDETRAAEATGQHVGLDAPCPGDQDSTRLSR